MLDDRKLKILAAVVDEYITTGEPVGSKAISAHPDINVSSATIRNDMALLEQLGYLEQPHTSAGRIPTYNGYRLYIEKLMPQYQLTDDEKQMLDNYLDLDDPSGEALVESASKALAELTHCASVVTNEFSQFSVISKVEVIPTGKRMYVLLLITTEGNIKNKVCRLEFDLTNEQLNFFTEYMKENLQGIAVESLSEEMLNKLYEAMGTYMMTLSPLLQGVYELAQGFQDSTVQVNGEKNLLVRSDIDRHELATFFEHKNEFTRMLDNSFSDLQVVFGEDGKFVINNSSMIVSKFKKGNKTAGSLGLIGPMRLNYSKIIPYLEYFTNKISEIMSEDDNDDENNKEK